MLGVGVAVGVGGLGAAAASARPLSSLPSLCRRRRQVQRCSWFSNPAAADERRDSSTSSRATRRRWWSDAYQDDLGEEEEEDPFPSLGGELFDEPWFSKVFKTYGYLLPVMLASMLVATGPRAFLMAMAIPLAQSAISFLLDAIWGRRRRSERDSRWRQQPFEEEEEDWPSADYATGGERNRNRDSSSSYRSWVSDDFDAATDADDYTTKSNNNNRGGDGGSKSSGGGFGGWDELLHDDDDRSEEKNKASSSGGDTSTYFSPQATVEEDVDPDDDASDSPRVGLGMGAPIARRRRRPRRRMSTRSSKYRQAPLLMRLLVAVFPFLGSWFRLL